MPSGILRGNPRRSGDPFSTRAIIFAGAWRPIQRDPKPGFAWFMSLLELNELADASRLLAEHDWAPAGAIAEYLARLFEGDLHERREDRAAAAAAYDRAIALVAMSQSARVAKAHALHLDGQRRRRSKPRSTRCRTLRSGGPLVVLHRWIGVAFRAVFEDRAVDGDQVRPLTLLLAFGWRRSRARPDVSPVRPIQGRVAAVRVDALVTDGRRPVTGLTAANFELRDNGVVQTIIDVIRRRCPSISSRCST